MVTCTTGQPIKGGSQPAGDGWVTPNSHFLLGTSSENYWTFNFTPSIGRYLHI
jgi:hypothetical protein